MGRYLRGTAYLPQKGDTARRAGGRRQLRDIVVTGSAGPGISAYNKVDPVNPGTVYQNFKGPFVTNQTYWHGEELWVKFSQPISYYPAGKYVKINVEDTGERPSIINSAGCTPIPAFSSGWYRGGVYADLILENWDPSTLCYNNAPYYWPLGNANERKNWYPDTPQAYSAAYLDIELVTMPANVRVYLQSIIESGGAPTPDPKLRSMRKVPGGQTGFARFNALDGPDLRLATLIPIAAAPAPTLTTFKFDGWNTAAEYYRYEHDDDWPVGWTLYWLDGANAGEVRTIASYDSASQTVTLNSALPFAGYDADAVYMFKKAYGIRFYTYADNAFVGQNLAFPPAAPFPVFTWPGVSSVSVTP